MGKQGDGVVLSRIADDLVQNEFLSKGIRFLGNQAEKALFNKDEELEIEKAANAVLGSHPDALDLVSTIKGQLLNLVFGIVNDYGLTPEEEEVFERLAKKAVLAGLKSQAKNKIAALSADESETALT